jgi:hypothetical protein
MVPNTETMQLLELLDHHDPITLLAVQLEAVLKMLTPIVNPLLFDLEAAEQSEN